MSAESKEQSKIDQTCTAIGRYYKSLGKQYNGKFSEFCDENALDVEDVEEELRQKPDECLVIDFDNKFPFPNTVETKEAQARFIYRLIVRCWKNPNHNFQSKIVDVNSAIVKELFKFSKKDLDDMAAVVKAVCPTYNLENDEGYLHFAAIQHKKDFPLLQLMMDYYQTARIKHGINVEKREFTELKTKWFENHPVTKLLKKIPFKNGDAAEMLSATMNMINARVCKVMILSPDVAIQESIELTIKFMHAAIKEAKRHLMFGSTVPFQLDFVLVTDTTAKKQQEQKQPQIDNDGDDDGDDDDNDGDEQKQPIRGLGNIEDALKQAGWMFASVEISNIEYETGQTDDDDNDGDEQKQPIRGLGNIEDALKQAGWMFASVEISNIEYETGQTNEVDGYGNLEYSTTLRSLRRKYDELWGKFFAKIKHDNIEAYLTEKRLIFLFDRRETEKDSSKIYLIQSKEWGNIPRNTIDEWYFSASQMSILPDMKSGEQIGSLFGCNGSLLTFSFHIKAANEMKMYLYWYGGIARFMPEFIPMVFPMIFAMTEQESANWGYANAEFVESQEMNSYITEMQKEAMLIDEKFQNFLNIQ
eukprot:482303_1